MPTPRTRTIVSRVATLASALTAALALGACAGHLSPAAHDAPLAAAAPVPTVRFDNEAQTYVDVYLIGEQREWLLGRVPPGARATLRIPASALAMPSGFVRLATIPDANRTVLAARDPRATFTIAQPASMIATQQWTFSQRQLASPQLLGAQRDRR